MTGQPIKDTRTGQDTPTGCVLSVRTALRTLSGHVPLSVRLVPRAPSAAPASRTIRSRAQGLINRPAPPSPSPSRLKSRRRRKYSNWTAARISQLHLPDPMRSCSDPVTSPRISSRFQRRLPGGRHDLVFKVAFGSDAAAARSLRRSKMTIWRWRHDRSPVPRWVFDVLVDLVQSKVADACAARQDLNYLRQLPPKPPRRLSGCCAGYTRL
jgi:hypothetical protein